ncbi:hypothetical protein PQX77_013683 [Marasmius sp. AFHP31]|nr:hypothetical protein PQX77_013683 [Marasmius sp. AFHP31]
MSGVETRDTSTTGKCSYCTFTPKYQHQPIPIEDFRSYSAPPVGSELTAILQLIADEEQDIDGYNLEIARLQALVVQLSNDKAALQQKIDHRRSYISVMRRIPSEVLTEIFGHCVGMNHLTLRSLDNADERAKTCHSTLTTPIRLSHVSRRWREILLHTPKLWTTLSLNLAAPEPETLLRTCLKRSRGMDLDVIVWDQSLTSRESHQLFAMRVKAFRLLMTPMLTARFKKLTMVDDGLSAAISNDQPLLADSAVLFPKLEYVHLAGALRNYPRPRWLWNGVRRAPRLCEAVLGSPDPIGLETFSGASIRALEIKPSRFQPVLRLLPTLHLLESLIIRCPEDNRAGFLFPPARCSRIQDLKLIYTGYEPHLAILSSLALPNLVSLHLDLANSDLSLSALSAFGALSSTLKKLTLTFERPYKDMLLSRILSRIPGLVEFEINLPQPSAHSSILNLFDQFTRKPAVGTQLQTLSFSMHPQGDLITHYFISKCVGYLETRNAMTVKGVESMARLKHFTLVGRFTSLHPFEYDSVMMGRMRDLEAHGTKCIIRELK